jgi:YD repeat-containing protein
MATRKKTAGSLAKVVKGTHLTVTTDENGKTTLEWDDEQLLKEVRAAIASVKPMKPAVKAKSIKKVPEAMKRKVDDKVLDAYNDERLVAKHDKIQAVKKTPTKKSTTKKKS